MNLVAPRNVLIAVDDRTTTLTIADTVYAVTSTTLTVDGAVVYDDAWLGGFTGTVVDVPGLGRQMSVTAPADWDEKPLVILVHAHNAHAEVLDDAYALFARQPIAPVTPLPETSLVAGTQELIIDFLYAPLSVTVQGVVAWTSTGGFQNGWGGNYVVSAEVTRLVLDQPLPLTGLVTISATAAGDHALDYRFYAALERLTTSGDVIAPQIVKATSYVWSARVHIDDDDGDLPPQFDGAGNVYLHVLDPRGSEVLVVPGTQVGVVYDPTLAKVIIYFTRNETVFYMTADASDAPTTQSHLRSLETTVPVPPAGGGAETIAVASYPPIKFMLIDELSLLAAGGGAAKPTFSATPYDRAPTPAIITGVNSHDEVILRLARVTAAAEDAIFAAYDVIKFVAGTPNVIGRVVAFVGDYVDFVDDVITPHCAYALVPRYVVNGVEIASVIGAWTTLEDHGVGENVRRPPVGGGAAWPTWAEASFPPLKTGLIENGSLSPAGSGAAVPSWVDSAFPPIGT